MRGQLNRSLLLDRWGDRTRPLNNGGTASCSPIMRELIVISRRGAPLYESSTRAILGISGQRPASIAPTCKSDIPPTEQAIRKSSTYSRPGPHRVHFQNPFV